MKNGLCNDDVHVRVVLSFRKRIKVSIKRELSSILEDKVVAFVFILSAPSGQT